MVRTDINSVKPAWSILHVELKANVHFLQRGMIEDVTHNTQTHTHTHIHTYTHTHTERLVYTCC